MHLRRQLFVVNWHCLGEEFFCFWSLFSHFEAINCGKPTLPDHGSVSGVSTRYPHSITFTCIIGYEIYGSVVRRCQANGTWSGNKTTCKRKIHCLFFRSFLFITRSSKWSTTAHAYLVNLIVLFSPRKWISLSQVFFLNLCFKKPVRCVVLSDSFLLGTKKTHEDKKQISQSIMQILDKPNFNFGKHL